MSPSPPRILWVTAEAPDRFRGGGAIRQAHLIEALADQCSVDLVVVGKLTDAGLRDRLGAVHEVAPPAPVRRGPVRRRVWDALRLSMGRPAELADRTAERFALRRALAGLGRQASYDLVHVEHLGLAGVVPSGLGRCSSLGVQNVPSVMAGHAEAVATGRRARWLWKGEQRAARRWESTAARRTDALVVVSEDDGAAFPTARRLLVVANGVDLARFAVSALPTSRRVVFTGTLDYLPNVDAAEWFVTRVWPEVRRRLPDAELDIVGRSPTPAVQGLARAPGVTLQRDVPDTAGFLAAARVAVVPVRIGSGTRLKALEAMASGRPVVGTSIGLAGLGIRPGVEAMIADEPDRLAATVVDLLSDDDLAGRLAEEGRRLVEARYGWDRIGADFSAAVAELLG